MLREKEEKCSACDGDGFYEVDVSCDTPYGIFEKFDSETCPECEGVGVLYEVVEVNKTNRKDG
tara:strand:+ start:43 stop:231 length:189 start_codon:yes stop_codon:yes gene_type:complete